MIVMTRFLFPAFVLTLWMGSMAWLVHHDLWPVWTAKEAPAVGIDRLRLHAVDPAQVGIYDSTGRRVGGVWTTYSGHSDVFSRTDEFRLDYVQFVGSVLAICEADFDGSNELRAFRVHIHFPEADFPILVEGERFHSRIAVAIRAGAYYQALDLDGGKTAMISEMFRPFSNLPNLSVGQTWRMQVLDPLKLVLQKEDPFVPMIARVTGKSTVDRPEGPVECFVVEADDVTAMIAVDGTVLEQRVTLPGYGPITLREEPYEKPLRDEALRLLPERRAWRFMRSPSD